MKIIISSIIPAPSWNGMMHMLHKDCDHPGSSSVIFLPIIDMYSGDKSCIFSTLEYLCNLADKHRSAAVLKGDSVLKSCAKMFSTPKKNIAEIEDAGCKAMVALFGGKPGDNLSAMRYSSLCQKVGSAKSFVTPERLPPTSSATKYHALRSYLQMMLWMDNGEAMDTTEWGWELQNNSLVPVMMDTSPAPETLLKIIHCNCSDGCSTLRCTSKRHGLYLFTGMRTMSRRAVTI
ncbi:uncharacterized protein LOC143038235 [Oratosquilla oratoria]|uniref:uncharacterized protein LOC143038235 n=1 Tax=Oratosquilla oratoria TaxID=337810 RepID=UPI003F75D288